MTAEIEAAVVDGSFDRPGRAPRRRIGRAKPHHVVPVGSPCPNCEAILQGAWCHACGQSAADLHRSIRRLSMAAFEDLLQFDGRFWRTVPQLAFKPGQLTKAYIAGRRASQIPPLRMFLIALLVVFFAGSLRSGDRFLFDSKPNAPKAGVPTAPKVMHRADVQQEINNAIEEARADADTRNDMDELKASVGSGELKQAGNWFQRKAKSAGADPARFQAVLEEWGHRFAILALPISAAILSVLYVFQRRFYIFDHLVFSMHSLAFQGFLLSPVLAFGGVWSWLMWLSPVHLFVHLRGAYGSGVFSTLVRMSLLFVISSTAFAMLMLALVMVGLAVTKG